MNNKTYIEYIHDKRKINTIEQFLDPLSNSITRQSLLHKEDLLGYMGDTGISNLDRIWDEYDDEEKNQYQSDYEGGILSLLKINTHLLLPISKLETEILAIQGKNQVFTQKNFNTFLAENLRTLLFDPKYVSIHKSEFETFKSIYPNFSVWVWCRALSNNDQGELLGQLIDITPFVNSITTNVTKTGGNFQISLAPLVAEYGKNGVWNIKKDTIKYFGTEYIAQVGIYDIKDGSYKDQKYYFHQILGSNDLVFIRFEALANEYKRNEPYNYFLSFNQIPFNIYDMIGLIDSNQNNITYANNEVSISIGGRDLVKVIIEDGSYFYPLQFAMPPGINAQDSNKFVKRNFSSGNYEISIAYKYRDVQTTLQFMMNQLSNMGCVPDSVFNAYGSVNGKDIRTYWSREEGEVLANGVYQIIELAIDENVSDRLIKDSSVSQPDGSIFNQFQKVCQEPFVEFFTDTYGNKFHFIVRQPPFTRDHILDYVRNVPVIEIQKEDVIAHQFQYDEDGIFSFFQIIPQASYLGKADNMALADIPIIFLPEYADIWGNKRLAVTSQYISYDAIAGNKAKEDIDIYKEQVIKDLIYIINCNAYNPFTRIGTITINGDRRIKRGTWVKLALTNELCYVESVSQNYSISTNSTDRITVLQLSRCMIFDYILGKDVEIINDEGKKENIGVSYFNIINTDIIYEKLMEQTKARRNKTIDLKKSFTDTQVFGSKTDETTVKNSLIQENFVVNKDVFNFFLKKRQNE